MTTDADTASPEPPTGTTREQIDEARDWVASCMWQEDPEEIAEMTDEEIIRGVEHHYDGGWSELVRNAGLDDREVE